MLNKKPGSVLKLTAAVAVLLFGLTSCGGTSEIGKNEAGHDRIVLAEQDVVDSAPVWLAQEQGYFENEGLEVEIIPGSDGSSSSQIPLIISGSADAVITTSTAMIQAAAQGINVKVAAGLTTFGDDVDTEPSGILVSGNSEIKNSKDLEGKTIAVNGLKSLSEALVREMISNEGGDPSTVDFLQVPTGNIGDIVRTGGADAGYLPDPFFSSEVEKGLVVLARPAAVVAAGMSTTAVIVTTDFAESNEDVIAKLQRAIERGVEFARDNPEDVMRITAEKLKISVDELRNSTAPTFSAEIDQKKLQGLIDILLNHGALETSIEVSDVTL